MGFKTEEQKKLYHAKYYQKNKDRFREAARKRNIKYADEIREYKRQWGRKKRGSTEDSLLKSEVWKGRKGELFALTILEDSVDLNKEKMNRPFDILWRGKTVDVKTLNICKRKKIRGKEIKREPSGHWTVIKGKNSADFYLCVCLENEKPKKIYLIPGTAFKKAITIGNKSKYDKFLYVV